MTGDKQLFDPSAGYIVTASHQWPNFNEEVFTLFYQPILGPVAFAMFHALQTRLQNQPVISDRHLQSQLLIQLNDGRQAADDALQRLEAVGMLRTFHQEDQLGELFVYELQPTIPPAEFINDNLLSVLLLEAVGEERFKELSRYAERFSLSDKASLKEVTHHFFDAFHVDEQRITHLPDEIKKAQVRMKDEQSYQQKPKITANDFDWPTLVQLLNKQPITETDLEANRELIEVEHRLYGIDEPKLARILPQATDLVTNKIQPKKLKQLIASGYRVDAVKHEAPVDNHDSTKTQTSFSNEEQQLIETCKYYPPVTFLQQLKQQMGGFVTSSERSIIRSLIQEQQLEPSVVNVLSWYVIASLGKATLQANYVNAIANNWMRAGVTTPESALAHIQNFTSQKNQRQTGKRTTYRQRQATTVREKMPAWSKQKEEQSEKSTPEQLNRLRERLARRRKSANPKGDESK